MSSKSSQKMILKSDAGNIIQNNLIFNQYMIEDDHIYAMLKCQLQENIAIKQVRWNCISFFKFGEQKYVRFGDYCTKQAKWLVSFSVRIIVDQERKYQRCYIPTKDTDHLFEQGKQSFEFGQEIEELIGELIEQDGKGFNATVLQCETAGIDFKNSWYERKIMDLIQKKMIKK